MADDEVASVTYPPILVTQTELSGRMGLTTRWIFDLTKDGVFQQLEGKKYDLCAAMLAYGEYKVGKAVEKKAPSATDNLTKRKEDLIARRLAREDRTIIEMSEAMDTVDFITGAFNEAFSGLPARLTRDIQERKRIEAICDGVRTKLSEQFDEQRDALRSGKPAGEANPEDDT